MKEKPRVGQKVRFNNWGLEQCFGSTLGLKHMRSQIFIVTWVEDESMTDDCGTWPIEVDDQEVTQFCLDNHCFDDAEPKDGYAIVLEG